MIQRRDGHEDENIGPSIVYLTWSLATLSIILVGLRFYTRIFIVRMLRWDDWVMLLALLLGIVNSAFVQVAVDFGLGRHIETLAPLDAMNAIKWDYLAQPTAIMSPAFGRVAFAMMLLGVVGTTKFRRWSLYGIIASQLVVNSLTFILILVQCTPLELLWDKRLEGSCWDLRIQEYTGYFQGSYNSVVDLALAVFPAFVIWNLQMKTSVKISVIILMGLGIFAMAASIAKTILLKSVGSNTDYTWTTAFLVIWWTVELYIVIIAASVPALKPLLRKAVGTTKGNTYPTGSYGMKSNVASRSKLQEDASSINSNGSSEAKSPYAGSPPSGGDILRTVEYSVDSARASSPFKRQDFHGV